jgi:hypothetical protein
MVNVASFVYVSIVLQPRKPLRGFGGEKRGKETERGQPPHYAFLLRMQETH